MLVKVKMPKLAETTDVVVIEEWMVAPGDTVSIEQALASVETDKVNVDLPSPVAGVLREILVAEGDEVRTGDPVCTIEA